MIDPERPIAAGLSSPDVPPPVSAAAPLPVPPGDSRAIPPTIPPLADVIAKPARRANRGSSLLLVLAGAVAIGGVAFAAGRLTAPATAATGVRGAGLLPGSGQLPGGGQLPTNGQGFPGRGGAGGISLQGTVTAIAADAITLELDSGTTVTIPVDGATAYRTASPATSDAVQVGSEVAITPGARVADPSASPDPNAAPGQGGGMSFGAASTVTVLEP